MTDTILTQLRDIIQEDAGQRGLARDPQHNLINSCPDGFRNACHSVADHPSPGLAIVTGFFIPTASPPAGETDGPLGALYLARTLTPLGIRVALVTDDFCAQALEAGLAECGLANEVPLVILPTPAQACDLSPADYWRYFDQRKGSIHLTHLLAIERVGPSHYRAEVPADQRGRCHTMRGRDITDFMSPAHQLFLGSRGITTIGIGDGGNEIGMGKVPWSVIERNITNGGLIACATAVDHLIVCGVSNWGAYALSAGIRLLAGRNDDPDVFDPVREKQLLTLMVEKGPLVDGVAGAPQATVDGLTWERYAAVLGHIERVTQRESSGRGYPRITLRGLFE